MAVPSPFQCTAADGEGVWASGMSHSHNELACCAIQYKKGKRKQKHTLKIGWLLSKQSKQATRRLTSPPLVCCNCHNNLLLYFEKSLAKTQK